MTLALRVSAMRWECDGILALSLRSRDGAPLPGYEPGAHVDLTLAPGLVRSYSLLDGNSGRAALEYRIGVALDAKSRGGSLRVHRHLRPGDVLESTTPRNNFPLSEGSPFTQLVAGGIGVTPLLAMAERLSAQGRAWRMQWCVRDRDHLPFQDWLSRHAEYVDLHVDAEAGGVWSGWNDLVTSLPAGSHLYCCGPAPMLAAYEAATRTIDPDRVHLEHFAAKLPPPRADDRTLTVRLARTGATVIVASDQTILDALMASGLQAPHSCLQGVCGACETRVIEGTPDHRDLVLSPAERARGETMMICCSRALTPELVLDL